MIRVHGHHSSDVALQYPPQFGLKSSMAVVSETDSAAQFQLADESIESQSYAEAESILKKLLARPYETDVELREHERALTTLGSLYKTQK